MGLLIKSTEQTKVQMQGLDGNVTDIESVYARLEFACRPDGKTIECAFPYIFMSKDAYKLNAPVLKTNVPTSVSGEVLEQSMLSAHNLCKEHLEKIGFEVEIDL